MKHSATAILLLLALSMPTHAEEVSAIVHNYGHVQLEDSAKGLKIHLQLFTVPFSMFSYRLVDNCENQRIPQPRARYLINGSVISNREGHASGVRYFARTTISQLRQAGTEGFMLYIHDHNRLRFVSCTNLFKEQIVMPQTPPWVPPLLPQQPAPLRDEGFNP